MPLTPRPSPFAPYTICSQGRVPTCPMCQATIALRVRYHWPFRAVPRSRLHDEPVQPQFGVEGDGGLDPGIRGIRMLTYVLRVS